jgi:DNA-binding NarL/FixJ family response regulator
MLHSATVGIVSASPGTMFQLVQCVRRVSASVYATARSRDELPRVLSGPDDLLLICGVAEHRWVAEARQTLRGRLVRSIVIIGTTEDSTVLADVLANGAVAVLPLDAIDHELPLAIQMAESGRVWFPASVMPLIAHALALRALTTATAASAAGPSAEPDSGPHLSLREAEVVALAAKGYGNREIAERLGIAVKTVETYKHRVKLRFNLTTRAGISAVAEREGLLGRPTPARGQSAVYPAVQVREMTEDNLAD